MCTVAILRQVHPDYPLVIAANRDEFYARTARPPELLSEAPRAIGGVDEVQGGTWMGATARGFFAGITNQRTWTGSEPGLASRGQVVKRALLAGAVAEVRAQLAELDPRAYNPFNLLFGTADELWVAYARRDRASLELAPIPIGLSVLPNDRLDSPAFPKVERLKTLVRPAAAEPWERAVERIHEALADHLTPPPETLPIPPEGSPLTAELVEQLQALCIHTPFYGTRSSTIVALEEGRTARYLYADGPPCQHTYHDYTDLLA